MNQPLPTGAPAACPAPLRGRQGRGRHRQVLAALTAATALSLTPSAAARAATSPASAPTGAPTGTSASASGSASHFRGGDDLAWAPPRLTDPTTIRITSTTGSLKLKRDRDYVLDLPGTTVRLAGGLRVWGGRNVVLIGGTIDASGGRAVYLHGQSGTVHVEGLRIVGRDVHEGINIAEDDPRATVQLENIRIDRVNGSYSTHHADLLQVWAGPSALRVDRFEGSSTYQGFFFQPTQFTKKSRPDLYDLRNVVLRDAAGRSSYLLWQSDTFPIRTRNVTVVRNPDKPFPAQVMWPKNGEVWAGVSDGDRSTPSPLTGDPGTGYSSPGYASSAAARTAGGAAGPSSTTPASTTAASGSTAALGSSASPDSSAVLDEANGGRNADGGRTEDATSEDPARDAAGTSHSDGADQDDGDQHPVAARG